MSIVVVAGASGFVGRKLVERLVRDGVTVRCGTRDPVSARRARPDLDWVKLDVDAGDLGEALAGADALVYLVHQMQEDHGDELIAREEAAATRVVRACEAAGVRRIVYLGGPVPAGKPSPHLQSRLRTGERLRSGKPSAIELRAAMIIGVGSESWMIVRDLAMRLPVMVLPRWMASRSSPIAVGDVVEALVAAISDPTKESVAFDLPGPEVLPAREILERVSKMAGFRAVMIPVPVLSPSLSVRWLRFVSRADYGIASQLVAGLTSDMIPKSPGYWARMGREPTPLDEAIRAALEGDRVESWRGRLVERVVRKIALKAG